MTDKKNKPGPKALVHFATCAETPKTASPKLTNVSMTREEFAERFANPPVGPKDGSYFIRGPLKDDTVPERKDEALERSSFVVLDSDSSIDLETEEITKGGPDPFLLHLALVDMGFNHVVAFSHSHGKHGPDYFRCRAYVFCDLKEKGQLEPTAKRLVAKLNEEEELGLAYADENSVWSQPWFDARKRDEDAEHFVYTHFTGHDLQPEAPSSPASVAPAPGSADSFAAFAGLGGGDSPIARYNAVHGTEEAMRAVLVANGYELKHTGKDEQGRNRYRFLAPGSESKEPGCNMFYTKAGKLKVWSHHGAHCPISACGANEEKQAVDAFDLYRIFEHGGNEKEALAAWAETEKETEATGSITEVFCSTEAPEGKRAISEMLNSVEEIAPPGMLAIVRERIESQAWRSQPELNLMGAIALCSVLVGKRYRTTTGATSMLYLLNVAPTGAGKDIALAEPIRILKAAELGVLIGPGSFTSYAAVETTLREKAPQYVAMDEFGQQLVEMKDNTQKAAQMRALFTAWTSSNSTMPVTQYSSGGKAPATRLEPIERPHITLLGNSTPEILFVVIGDKEMDEGFLNRCTVSITDRVGDDLEPVLCDVPQNISDWCRAVKERPSIAFMLDEGPEVIELPFDEGALQICKNLKALLGHPEKGGLLLEMARRNMRGVLMRTAEKADRLALIAQLAIDPLSEKITAPAMEWASSFSLRADLTMAAQFEEHTFGSDNDRMRKEVLWVLRRHSKRGITTGQIRNLVSRGSLFRIELSVAQAQNFIRGRLHAEGLVEDIKTGGQKAHHWRVTPRGKVEDYGG